MRGPAEARRASLVITASRASLTAASLSGANPNPNTNPDPNPTPTPNPNPNQEMLVQLRAALATESSRVG